MATLVAGPQTLGLRTRRQLGRWSEARSASLGTTTALAVTMAERPVALTTRPVAVAARSITVTTATLAIARALPVATAAITTPAIAAVTAVTRGALLGDRFELVVDDQLEQAAAFAAPFGREHRRDVDAVDVVFCLGAQLIADRGTVRKDRSIEHPLGLTSPCGAPGPRAICCDTRQFDVDPCRHRPKRYPARPDLPVPCSHSIGGMPIYALGSQQPTIDATVLVHPDAVVIGSVTIDRVVDLAVAVLRATTRSRSGRTSIRTQRAAHHA